MPRRRSNPYTEPHPADWSSMTKLQRSAWNRSHWSKDGVSAPRPFAVRAAERAYQEALKKTGKRNPKVVFRAKGKRVAFVAKRKKARGKVPKHLRPYLFKKGHKAKAKRTKRKGATRACRGRRKVRMTSRRCRRASR